MTAWYTLISNVEINDSCHRWVLQGHYSNDKRWMHVSQGWLKSVIFSYSYSSVSYYIFHDKLRKSIKRLASYIVRRNLNISSSSVRKQACKSLIRPSLEYTWFSWDPYNKGEIDQLQIAPRRATMFVTIEKRSWSILSLNDTTERLWSMTAWYTLISNVEINDSCHRWVLQGHISY
jgi:hypothetical protein